MRSPFPPDPPPHPSRKPCGAGVCAGGARPSTRPWVGGRLAEARHPTRWRRPPPHAHPLLVPFLRCEVFRRFWGCRQHMVIGTSSRNTTIASTTQSSWRRAPSSLTASCTSASTKCSSKRVGFAGLLGARLGPRETPQSRASAIRFGLSALVLRLWRRARSERLSKPMKASTPVKNTVVFERSVLSRALLAQLRQLREGGRLGDARWAK